MERNEIKYAALSELGYTEEPNFNDDDDNGVNAINEAYDRIYSLCLQSHDWLFAKASAELEGLPNEGRFKYMFYLPEGVEYIRGIYYDNTCKKTVDSYDKNGDVLFSNEKNIYIEYTKKICESELPAYFSEYLIYALARKCCTKITGDATLLQELIENEKNEFALAKNTDIKQMPVRYLDTNVFLEVRN